MATNTYSTDLESTSSQFWSHADNAVLSFTGDFTFEIWVKPESITTTHYLISKDDSGGGDRGYGFRLNSDGTATCLYFDGNTFPTNQTLVNTDAAIATAGTWTHIAVSVDVSTGAMVFYKDGSSVASTAVRTNATSVRDSAAPFQIGAVESGQFFDGLIDEVRIWNDIRTSGEISSNYDTELNGDEAGLIGYWKFNNDGTDSTSNGNDLTNNNSATFSTDVPFTGGGGGGTTTKDLSWQWDQWSNTSK